MHVQDAKVLRNLLAAHDTVDFDVDRRVLVFGTASVG